MKTLIRLLKTLALAYLVWSAPVLHAGSVGTAEKTTTAVSAYIVTPKHGETVSSPVTVVFGLQGMGVAPAGVQREGTGHHHLLVDYDGLPPLDQPLGSDVKHFGGGQTQTTIELAPGEHTLQLILGDHLHRPHNPPVVSQKITIIVAPKTIEKLDIKNLRQVSPAVYRSGQPTPEQLRELAAAGVRHIVNLRPDSELEWDEAALVAQLGMQYHHLPVAGVADINIENAGALTDVLTALKEEKTLVHCASSNRVGGLIAIGKSLEGANTEDAIAEGKRWGLTRLEPVVRQTIEPCDVC